MIGTWLTSPSGVAILEYLPGLVGLHQDIIRAAVKLAVEAYRQVRPVCELRVAGRPAASGPLCVERAQQRGDLESSVGSGER